MRRTRNIGLVVTVLGLVGYLVGVAQPYPGRAFSITGIMVGITLVTIGGVSSEERR
ncbi:hypothetical protein [Haladaptatus sp. NG-WS-4]